MTVTLRHKRLPKNLRKYTTKKEAMIKSGYTKSYAETGQIQKTAGYKKTTKPILQRYEKELRAILDAMELKNKNSEEYQVLISAADKMQKQIQLLSGGETERIAINTVSIKIKK